ncbi:MAG: acetyl-CoA carboxylase biotin carboxyl carrier protein subunit [Myxococcota bacterium]
MSRRVRYGDEALTIGARPDGGRGDGYVVHLGGRLLRVTAWTAPDGSMLVTTEDGRRFRAVVTPDGDVRWVTIGAKTVRVREAGHGGAAEAAEAGLEAPMPGKVLEVAVAAGDRVAAGDVLLIVEAMKMEHAIKAPHDGTVAQVTASAGDMVNPGTPLVTFEDEAS